MNRFCIALLTLSAVACSPKSAENAADTATRQMSSTNDRATVQLAIDSAMVRFRDGMLTGGAIVGRAHLTRRGVGGVFRGLG